MVISTYARRNKIDTSVPLGTCCTARTDATLPSKTNTELGRQLYGKITIRRIKKKQYSKTLFSEQKIS